MTTETLEIEKIYDFINLLKVSKRDVGEHIKITSKLIEDFRITLKGVTQFDKEITDPNLHCFVSFVNMQYDIPGSAGYPHALEGIGFGAVLGGLFGVVFGKVLGSAESLAAHPIHRGSVIAFTLLGATALGQNFFEEKLDQIKMDVLSDAMLRCYGSIEKVEISGILSDECEVIG
jgi:hypothetical protein